MTDTTAPQTTLGQDLRKLGAALFKFGLFLAAIFILFGGNRSHDDAPAAPKTTFKSDQFADIMDAARNNEARFERDYKGHILVITLPFHSSNTTIGSRQVWFGDHNIVCHPDEDAYFQTSNWSKGQHVVIAGYMKRAGFMGSLSLDNCVFKH